MGATADSSVDVPIRPADLPVLCATFEHAREHLPGLVGEPAEMAVEDLFETRGDSQTESLLGPSERRRVEPAIQRLKTAFAVSGHVRVETGPALQQVRMASGLEKFVIARGAWHRWRDPSHVLPGTYPFSMFVRLYEPGSLNPVGWLDVYAPDRMMDISLPIRFSPTGLDFP